MFPVGDDDSQRRTTPVVTFVLIGLNVLVFLVELSGGDQFITEWAFVPERFSAHPAANIATVFSAMFMHGGWLHLGGNMLFLWIFGDNVEDALGKLGYLAFYLIGGVAAGALQFVLGPNSTIPNVGASGAIAAVLGAYIVLYPRARILTAVFFFLITVIELPATVVLGLWFVLQLFQGVSGLAAQVNSGVAYWAHVGGFGFGAVVALLFLRGRRRPAVVPPSFPTYPGRPDLP
jgi:membrane associated rhomboid family serine protease